MDFGKLPGVNGVRFDFPPDDPRNENTHRSATESPDLAIRLGCPVWSRKEWIGRIYPARTPPRDFLHHYSRQFNAIELNSTFYGIPDERTLQHWRETVPEGFRFSPKWNQRITHEGALDRPAALEVTRAFCRALATLGPNLGLSFLQLPPEFPPARIQELDRLLAKVPAGFPVSIEFRHPAWFERGRLRNDAFALLARHRATAVITDVAGRRDVHHGSLPAPRVLIRFVGNSLHPTDFARADAWVKQLKLWRDQGLREACLFVHQPEDTDAPEMAAYLARKLNTELGVSLTVPGEKLLAPAREPDSQLSLFG